MSVLPMVSKIIERHVHDHLSEYLKCSRSSIRTGADLESSSAQRQHFPILLILNLDKNHINGMDLVDSKTWSIM